jgi:hypothetical protein
MKTMQDMNERRIQYRYKNMKTIQIDILKMKISVSQVKNLTIRLDQVEHRITGLETK